MRLHDSREFYDLLSEILSSRSRVSSGEERDLQSTPGATSRSDTLYKARRTSRALTRAPPSSRAATTASGALTRPLSFEPTCSSSDVTNECMRKRESDAKAWLSRRRSRVTLARRCLRSRPQCRTRGCHSFPVDANFFTAAKPRRFIYLIFYRSFV